MSLDYEAIYNMVELQEIPNHLETLPISATAPGSRKPLTSKGKLAALKMKRSAD